MDDLELPLFLEIPICLKKQLQKHQETFSRLGKPQNWIQNNKIMKEHTDCPDFIKAIITF